MLKISFSSFLSFELRQRPSEILLRVGEFRIDLKRFPEYFNGLGCVALPGQRYPEQGQCFGILAERVGAGKGVFHVLHAEGQTPLL